LFSFIRFIFSLARCYTGSFWIISVFKGPSSNRYLFSTRCGRVLAIGSHVIALTAIRWPFHDRVYQQPGRPASLRTSGPLAVTLVAAPFSSMHACLDLRLMFITGSSRFHLPQQRRSVAGVFVALRLLLHGRCRKQSRPIAVSLQLGVFNIQSNVHKASLLHDVITEYRIDLLVVTETWLLNERQSLKTSRPPLYPNFHVLYRFREKTTSILVASTSCRITTTIDSSSVDCLVIKVRARRCRLYKYIAHRLHRSTLSPLISFATNSVVCGLHDELLARFAKSTD